MRTIKLKQALGLGIAILGVTAGSAFAATTIDNSVDLMAGPGANFHTVARLDAGANVSVSRQSGDWCKLAAPSTGWVQCSDVTGFTPKASSVATASLKTGFKGYDFHADPVNGDAVPGGLHTPYRGSFM